MLTVARRAGVILFRLVQARRSAHPFLVPGNICPIVPAILEAAGQPFEEVDIEHDTLGMDKVACLERAATRPLSGVLFCHPYGAVDTAVASFFNDLRERQPGLLLIDDRCLCRPVFDGHVTPGADATLFSTGYGKYLDLGGGGFAFLGAGGLALPDERREIRELVSTAGTDRPGERRVDVLDTSPPSWRWDDHLERGLATLPRADEHKRRLNAIYSGSLPEGIALEPRFQQWRFNVLVPDPDGMVAALFAAGLLASRHYAPLSTNRQALPAARALHASVVNLFNDFRFDPTMAEQAASIVRRQLTNTVPQRIA